LVEDNIKREKEGRQRFEDRAIYHSIRVIRQRGFAAAAVVKHWGIQGENHSATLLWHGGWWV
jgi:acetolactate synthase regulatory subunit